MKTFNSSFKNILSNKKDIQYPNYQKINKLILKIQNDYKQKDELQNLLINSMSLAKILNFKDIENWLYLELNGYRNNHELPDYRKIPADLKVFNPYMGWEPLNIYDQNLANNLKFYSIDLSLPKIMNLLKNNSESIEFLFCQEIENTLCNFINYDFADFKVACIFDSSDFKKIINFVINNIIDFTNELKEQDYNTITETKSEIDTYKNIKKYFKNNEIPKYKIQDDKIEKI